MILGFFSLAALGGEIVCEDLCHLEMKANKVQMLKYFFALVFISLKSNKESKKKGHKTIPARPSSVASKFVREIFDGNKTRKYEKKVSILDAFFDEKLFIEIHPKTYVKEGESEGKVKKIKNCLRKGG